MQRKALVGTILMVVALIMVVMALVMPWWKIEVTASAGGTSISGDMNFHLDHYEMDMMGMSEEQSYGDEASDRAFKTTQIFAYLALIGCIVGLIGAALVMMEKASSKVGAALIQLAVILCLIAPLYLMFTLPGAIKEDFGSIDVEGEEFLSPKMGESFFGSDEIEIDMYGTTVTAEYNWGGSTGWFLPIIALILGIAAMILVATSQPAPAAVPPGQPMPLSTYVHPGVQQPGAYAPQPPPSQAPPPGAPPPSLPIYLPAPPPPPQQAQYPSPPQPSACQQCGTPFRPGTTFCENCGTRVG